MLSVLVKSAFGYIGGQFVHFLVNIGTRIAKQQKAHTYIACRYACVYLPYLFQ
jgi:hypothetical protein